MVGAAGLCRPGRIPRAVYDNNGPVDLCRWESGEVVYDFTFGLSRFGTLRTRMNAGDAFATIFARNTVA